MIDTTSEMVSAYIVAGVIYVAYCVLLWTRANRLRARLAGQRHSSSPAE